MQYKRRPKTVEAKQWFPPGHPDHVGIEGITQGYVPGFKASARDRQYNNYVPDYYFLDTERGKVLVRSGDFIVTDEHGNRFPLAPEQFEDSYSANLLTNV